MISTIGIISTIQLNMYIQLSLNSCFDAARTAQARSAARLLRCCTRPNDRIWLHCANMLDYRMVTKAPGKKFFFVNLCKFDQYTLVKFLSSRSSRRRVLGMFCFLKMIFVPPQFGGGQRGIFFQIFPELGQCGPTIWLFQFLAILQKCRMKKKKE